VNSSPRSTYVRCLRGDTSFFRQSLTDRFWIPIDLSHGRTD
jgi:hypothetical protein